MDIKGEDFGSVYLEPKKKLSQIIIDLPFSIEYDDLSPW